jgi:hypothetical protein
MNNNKDKFQVISLCEKFLCRFCETLKGCDREYRETVVKDLYMDIKKMMCYIQYANDRLKRGSKKRLELQAEAIQISDNLLTMLDSVCRLCKTGAKKQAALDKDLCYIRDKLKNWYASDQNAHVQYLQKQMMDVQKKFRESVDYYNRINEWCTLHPTEKNNEALEQSKSYCRAQKAAYDALKAEYDKANGELSKMTSIDYTLMGQVLKEIESGKVK